MIDNLFQRSQRINLREKAVHRARSQVTLITFLLFSLNTGQGCTVQYSVRVAGNHSAYNDLIDNKNYLALQLQHFIAYFLITLSCPVVSWYLQSKVLLFSITPTSQSQSSISRQDLLTAMLLFLIQSIIFVLWSQLTSPPLHCTHLVSADCYAGYTALYVGLWGGYRQMFFTGYIYMYPYSFINSAIMQSTYIVIIIQYSFTA